MDKAGDDLVLNRKLLKDIEFIVEIDKMKTIFRQTSLIGVDQRENDAEHSWHIALMAVILEEYSNKKIDILKVIKMLLTHDLVEIYAGDTFCYDVKGNKDKREREVKAAERIYGMLDEEKGSELRLLWDEFEEMKSPEALFAASMDRMQPMLNNYYNDGGTWVKYDVEKESIYKRIAPVEKTSDELWEYLKYIIEDAEKRGYINR